jgi:hypothetical protein
MQIVPPMSAPLDVRPEDEGLAAASPFHAWWLAELRTSLAPTASEIEPAAGSDCPPASSRKKPNLHRVKLALLCAASLLSGAAVTALLERAPARAAQRTTAAGAPTGIVEVGEIKVMSRPPAVAKLDVSARAVTVEPPFNRKAAAAAVSAAAARTSVCSDGRQRGSARVMITFAPSGRATSAMVAGGELGRSPLGICIADQMQSASVPPFSGQDVTVSKTVHFR